jgi:GNAT superfamily N-acetyltransferase
VVIRPRTDADADALVALLEVVHARDGYPPVFGRSGLRGFLLGPEPIGAWVAEIDGEVVGHVALHDKSLDETMAAVRAELGTADDGVAVVARLFVGPAGRGRRVGEALLAVGAEAARALGRTPILDTWQELRHAIALYDRCGWRRIAAPTAIIAGKKIETYVYVAPSATGTL